MSLWILPLIAILSVSPDSTHVGEYKFAEMPVGVMSSITMVFRTQKNGDMM